MPDRIVSGPKDVVRHAGKTAGSSLFDCPPDEFSQWLSPAINDQNQIVRRRIDAPSPVPPPRLGRTRSRCQAKIGAPIEVIPKIDADPNVDSDANSLSAGNSANVATNVSASLQYPPSASDRDTTNSYVVPDHTWAARLRTQRLLRLLAMEQQCYDARMAAERTAEQWLQLYEYQQDKWHHQTPLAPTKPMQ